jgi:hypothetical protein
MEKVKIFYSKESDSKDIWFGIPEDEYISEEAGYGIIFKKDKYGEVIGIEKLFVSKTINNKDAMDVEFVSI